MGDERLSDLMVLDVEKEEDITYNMTYKSRKKLLVYLLHSKIAGIRFCKI
jgi:hypothetical protein